MSTLTYRRRGTHPLIILKEKIHKQRSKKINKINSGIQPQNLNQIVMIAFPLAQEKWKTETML